MELDTLLAKLEGFQWDRGNQLKNWEKHEVNYLEAEQVFFNEPILLYDDDKHSKNEKRYYVLGQTDCARKLFICFTIRKNLIRVISARDMNKKERHHYDQA